MSPYVRALRERVGSMRILLPSVTALIRDERGRLLLVRQRDGGVWSTPGGAIEPDESPADAVVREAWEETGLRVVPVRLVDAHGGPECVVRYENGDETQYVMVIYECEVRGGALRADGLETTDLRFVDEPTARDLPLATWLVPVLRRFFDG